MMAQDAKPTPVEGCVFGNVGLGFGEAFHAARSASLLYPGRGAGAFPGAQHSAGGLCGANQAPAPPPLPSASNPTPVLSVASEIILVQWNPHIALICQRVFNYVLCVIFLSI